VAFGGHVEDSFDVVVPSLPGFGFSGKPTETGWTVARIASAWVELMQRLGYERWAAQGGDWGAVVTSALGDMRPEGLLGIHLNTQYAFPAQIPDTLSPEERDAVNTLALYAGDMGGANHLQGTKPETVGFARLTIWRVSPEPTHGRTARWLPPSPGPSRSARSSHRRWEWDARRCSIGSFGWPAIACGLTRAASTEAVRLPQRMGFRATLSW